MSKAQNTNKQKIVFFMVLIILITIAFTLFYTKQQDNNISQIKNDSIINNISSDVRKDIYFNRGGAQVDIDKMIEEGKNIIKDVDVSSPKLSFWDMIKIWTGLSNKADELSKNLEEGINNIEFPKDINFPNNVSSNRHFDKQDNMFTHFFEEHLFVIVLTIALFLLYLLWTIITHEKKSDNKVRKQSFITTKFSNKNNIHDEEGLL